MFQDLWKTICKVRSTYFPFDQQHCSLIIRSGAHDSQSIRFIQRRPIQGKSFIRGEWELVNAYTEIADERVSDFDQMNYSLVRFTLVLKRNELYYLIKIILPFTLVSFVTLFTFLLPPQTGEKLTLNVTILLSLVIYLQLLSEFIPKSDDETPILTLFCNANFFLVSLSCVMTVFVLYLYHRPTTAHIVCVPSQVKMVFLDCVSPWIYCNFHGEFKDERKLRSKSAEKKPKSLGSIEKRICQLLKSQTDEKATSQQVTVYCKKEQRRDRSICLGVGMAQSASTFEDSHSNGMVDPAGCQLWIRIRGRTDALQLSATFGWMATSRLGSRSNLFPSLHRGHALYRPPLRLGPFLHWK